MWNRNQGQTEDEILQNKFTAYVSRAVQRRNQAYLNKLERYLEMVCALEDADINRAAQNDGKITEKLPVLMKLQNEALLDALLMLSEREQYILLNYALQKKSLTELSQELGLSYKGAAAIYYRGIQKVRKRMEGGKNE